MDPFRSTSVDTNGWALIKEIEASAPGTFDNEVDWAGTNTPPTTGLISVPHQRRRSTFDNTFISIWVVAIDGANALLGRGSPEMAWTVQGVYVVRRRQELIHPAEYESPLAADIVVDSAGITTGVTLNREIRIPARAIDQFTTRFHTFTNVPGTAERLLVYWRPQ
jgi:hypothetical protein